MKDWVERAIISEELYGKYDFYRKGFWVCFAYGLWDTLYSFGLL